MRLFRKKFNYLCAIESLNERKNEDYYHDITFCVVGFVGIGGKNV